MTTQTFIQQKNLLHTGTHGCAIKLIGNDLINKNQSDYKSFQQLIPELKALREEADYSSKAIQQPDGYLALTKSDSIKSLLQKNYR